MPSISIAQDTLAARLSLLLDARKVNGLPADFATIQAGVQAHGANLSRPRWAYIRQPSSSHRTKDTAMLSALAAFFDVDGAYLIEDEAPIPEALQALIPAIRAQREAAVAAYAARLLGDVSPEKLEDLERVLAAA